VLAQLFFNPQPELLSLLWSEIPEVRVLGPNNTRPQPKLRSGVSRKGLEMSRIILTDSRVDVNIPEISLLSGKGIQRHTISALVAIQGCQLTCAIREEQSSYRENSVASAQRGKVKRSGSGGCQRNRNDHFALAEFKLPILIHNSQTFWGGRNG